MRGGLRPHLVQVVLRGNTPARAGRTTTGRISSSRTTEHPRVYGADVRPGRTPSSVFGTPRACEADNTSSPVCAFALGTPPHVRGGPDVAALSKRLISACGADL